MDSLSLDNFRQQQDYQRALFVPSRKKHHKKHHHKHKSRKHRSSRHHHSHRSKRSSRSKTYGSVTDQCAVCLDDETELDTRLFPCKHAFHGECLIEFSNLTILISFDFICLILLDCCFLLFWLINKIK